MIEKYRIKSLHELNNDNGSIYTIDIQYGTNHILLLDNGILRLITENAIFKLKYGEHNYNNKLGSKFIS